MKQDKLRVLFIHHSTGGNLIEQGKLREHIYKLSDKVEFWDHNYNLYPYFSKFFSKYTHHKGLSGPHGEFTGVEYDINLNNNNPKDYADIFSKEPGTDYTLKNIMDYDVIMFKKCFPTSKIKTDKQLESYKNSYIKIRRFVDKHPEKVFVVVTQPPLRSEVTNKEYAMRSRQLADFLKSKEFIGKRKNLRCFDFFDLLTDGDASASSAQANKNMLKRDYTPWFYRDSHPNSRANKEIAPKFAKFIVELA